MSSFKDLIDSLLPKYGDTKQRLAAAIGMTPSGFGRGVERNTLSIENLLKLARETGGNPTTLLRAAGKDELADLLEQLYGESRGAIYSAEERQLIEQFRAMTPRARASLMTIFNDLAGVRKQQRKTA